MSFDIFNTSLLAERHVGNTESLPGYHLLSQYVRQHQRVLIVTSNSLEALLVQEYLSKYRPDTFVFSDHELMPYDTFNVSGYIGGQRNSAVYKVLTQKKWVVVASVQAITYKLPPRSFYLQQCVNLTVGQDLKIEVFENLLVRCGFKYVSEVTQMAEFSKRGSIFDFYPPALELPLRIEFFDDTIESIRSFNPDSQLTDEKVASVEITPLSEYIAKEQELSRAIKNFKLHTGQSKSHFLSTLVSGQFPSGFQFYLPMLYDSLESIFDFIGDATKTVSFGDIKTAHFKLCDKIKQRSQMAKHTQGFASYSLNEIAIDSIDNISFDLALTKQSVSDKPALNCETFSQIQLDKPLKDLENQVKARKKTRWLFAVASMEKSTTLRQKLSSLFETPEIRQFQSLEDFIQSDEKVGVFIASFAKAFHLTEHQVAVISESWIYSFKPAPISKKAARKSSGFESLTELKKGHLVVHQDYGVARYEGLKVISVGSYEKEMNELVFADNDKLFVPTDDIALLSPYFSLEPESVQLHKLGSSKWNKQKEKAYSVALDQATELLEIYAARENSQGCAFKVSSDYAKFCEQFPYQETDDQIRVIEDVLEDMKSLRAMDRLICGDVGFGKTEVAMRAMFVAAQAGAQVAFLAPTTLLAQQHYESLVGRFHQWPINIELMIRGGKNEKVLSGLSQGSIDIVVGTHKIIQKSVQYKNLGLIVIDEEHRFGVAQKEQLKKRRSNVDVLCMTATPIPRTLSMSFHKLRDLSIIATPPERRLRVETLIYQENDSLMKEAAERELMRGGQIYYVHNDISTIEAQAQKLRKYFPDIQVGVVHGSMRESEQERVMSKFYHQDLDILVGTTIIETGLDVPNANTIFISQAHHLGLSQLHQLRGRVGRSYHQAYAYLFIPAPLENLPTNSQYRLNAIFENQDLGAGFQLASTDMEIRGAGSLLGDKQSGHVQDIGLETYKKLLEKARQSLDSSTTTEKELSCDIELFISTFIPEKQIPCPYLRLKVYKMWQSAKQLSQLQLYKNLFVDRFGKMLPETSNKFHYCCLKLKAREALVSKIKITRERVLIEMHSRFSKSDKVFKLAQSQPKLVSFGGPLSMDIKLKLAPERRVVFIDKFLDYLNGLKPDFDFAI